MTCVAWVIRFTSCRATIDQSTKSGRVKTRPIVTSQNHRSGCGEYLVNSSGQTIPPVDRHQTGVAAGFAAPGVNGASRPPALADVPGPAGWVPPKGTDTLSGSPLIPEVQ